MNPKHIAIFFETSEGHTTAVAERIRARLEQLGHRVSLSRCGKARSEEIEQADAVIVGGSIHAGRHQSKVVAFARRHAALLAAKPSAFFLVCLTAHSDKPDAPGIVAGYLEALTEQTDWRPRLARAFAGALLYTRYGFLKRKLMESINRKEGGETDTSRDHVYTDWQQVDAFADEAAAL